MRHIHHFPPVLERQKIVLTRPANVHTAHIFMGCFTPLVIQHIDGIAHLLFVIHHPDQHINNTVPHVREQYSQALRQLKRRLWSNLFTKVLIGTAQIYQVIEQHPEATLKYPLVFVDDFQHCEFLAHGWVNSKSHHDFQNMILSDNLVVTSSSPQEVIGGRAIVVRQILSKTKIAVVLLILLILGSIIGCIVGVCTRRADVAVAVTAGIFAFVAVLQSLVAWLAA